MILHTWQRNGCEVGRGTHAGTLIQYQDDHLVYFVRLDGTRVLHDGWTDRWPDEAYILGCMSKNRYWEKVDPDFIMDVGL